ncbi:MAG: hypothetical protein M1132_08845 [Chloroflexi bacterium]|nr:hypothetical protein [Chloroflexota bacterium]MCL5951814.1 hypothetical protein [Chloroflexota bacterium]
MAEVKTEQEMSWEDHLAAAVKGLRREWRAQVLPSEFWSHRRAAHREMLMACRSLLDARISKLEAEEEEKSAPKQSRIVVE